jgi:hypothetical protein
MTLTRYREPIFSNTAFLPSSPDSEMIPAILPLQSYLPYMPNVRCVNED